MTLGGTPTALAYDQANRLTAYGPTATYAYNAVGLRMSKTVASASSQFTWDLTGALPLVLADGANRYVYGPGGLPVEHVTASGSVYFYHHDQLGSTRLLTDANGVPQASFSYDAYGNLTGVTGLISTPLRWAAGYQDAESSLYYLRARYYDPSTGQFISRDPAVDTTRQPYSYTADNPLNATDPSGMCAQWDWGCIAANLAQLPAAIVHDVGEGQQNFVVNFQNGGYIAVGAPLLAAGGIAAYGLGAAAVGALGVGGTSAALNEAEQIAPGESSCTQGQLNWAQNILSQGGQNALLKSQGSIQAQLAAHQTKLAQIQAAGGYTSSVEREIANFQGQLNAIQRLQNP